MALIKCPECGSDISDQRPSCPKCGYPTKNNTLFSAPQINRPIRKSSISKWLAFLLLLIILALILKNNHSRIGNSFIPSNHTISLVQGSIIAKAGYYRSYEFSTIPNASNNRLSGRFQASGGTGDDIRVLIMTKDDYTNFVNGHSARSYYDSGQKTVSNIDVTLPSGSQKYVLVFDNTFSFVADKEVNANIKLSSIY
jgi:hypothetical protein